jgi:hypothetical protein
MGYRWSVRVPIDDDYGQAVASVNAVGFQALPDRFEPELVEPAERGQVSAGETRRRSSVVHVEVFRMGSVRTSILGRPRHLSRDRRASPHYTLNCEEPDYGT